jgi:hypothetical protein
MTFSIIGLMRNLRSLTAVLTAALMSLLLPSVHVSMAQPPVVVFIDDPTAQTAAASNEADDGVSRFAAVFAELGAEVVSAPLSAPLPDADLIVLVRPRAALSSEAAARLWTAVERGAHLLVAFDPAGQSGIAGEPASGGLAALLSRDYGLTLLDGFLIAPGMTASRIRQASTSALAVAPLPNGHPITAPLQDYDIAVTTWGARSALPDALGIDSAALPLLFTDVAYAETALGIFRENNPDPLELNLGQDRVGRLFTAAVGENKRRNGRAAILTDGEMLLNGFGFARDSAGFPTQIGNVIFASRLAAWLLDLPADAYPGLPDGYVYVRIDGDGSDWYAEVPIIRDRGADFPNARYNIRAISAFHNAQSIYILIETTARPDPASTLIFQFDSNDDRAADAFVTVSGERVFLQSGANVGVLAEARHAVDLAFELRLPLSFVGTTFIVCLAAPQGIAGDPDCSDAPIRAFPIALRDLLTAPRLSR